MQRGVGLEIEVLLAGTNDVLVDYQTVSHVAVFWQITPQFEALVDVRCVESDMVTLLNDDEDDPDVEHLCGGWGRTVSSEPVVSLSDLGYFLSPDGLVLTLADTVTIEEDDGWSVVIILVTISEKPLVDHIL